MKKYEFTPTEYYTFGYCCDNAYTIQNHLIHQHNFPLYFYEEDFVTTVYEDRIINWKNFWPKGFVRKKFSNMTIAEMMELIQAIWPNKNIVGFRLIHNKNISNGYDCDCLQVFGKGPRTPEMEFGENLAFNYCKRDRDYEWEHGGVYRGMSYNG